MEEANCHKIAMFSNYKTTYSNLLLCTGASLYAPYSFLLISNKFWMGRGGGESEGEKRGGRVGGGEYKG